MSNDKRSQHSESKSHSNSVKESEPELIQRGESEQSSTLVARASMFQGPIPDPETLAAYKEVDPKAVDWILNASNEERAHRHEMEKKVTDSHFTEARRGQNYAFGCVVIVMAASVSMSFMGQEIGASILGVGGLGTIVGIFVWGREKKDDDKENKDS